MKAGRQTGGAFRLPLCFRGLESRSWAVESQRPPVRLVTLKSSGQEFAVGNEVVLFRHEKTFYRKTGLFIRLKDNQSPEQPQSDDCQG